MNDMATVWFRSKVDWWLGVVLVLLPVVTVASGIAAIGSGEREGIVAMTVSTALVAAIYGLLVIPVRYGVGREHLIVRFGVVRQRIPLAAITEVYPTHSPLSSPALSLDRLMVRTGRGPLGMTLISPDDRETFLATLAFNAGLERDGDRLVRAHGGSR